MTSSVRRNLKSIATSRMNDGFAWANLSAVSACTRMKLRREDSVTIPPQNHSSIDVTKCCYF